MAAWAYHVLVERGSARVEDNLVEAGGRLGLDCTAERGLLTP